MQIVQRGVYIGELASMERTILSRGSARRAPVVVLTRAVSFYRRESGPGSVFLPSKRKTYRIGSCTLLMSGNSS